MRIYLAADHAGFELKQKLKVWLKELGYTTHDEGAFTHEKADDYPDFMHLVAKQVASNPAEDRGIILGGTGQGEAMVANRYPGVRAAVYYGGPDDILFLSRDHNDANVLSIGARFVDEQKIFDGVKFWLDTPFSNEPRHLRRIQKIDNEVIGEAPQF